MDQKERMLKGLPYLSDRDGLKEERIYAKKLLKEYNDSPDYDPERMKEVLDRLLGKHTDRLFIEPPFRCDYGYNIEVGDCFYSNYNLVILDCARVKIGDRVLFGPNVCITTAGHPIDPFQRSHNYYEYAAEITISDDVWIGANVVVNPGVTIGSGAVIGSGSVVTKDIPPMCVAAGNPCRVLREITEEDKKYYFKKKEWDVEP